MHGHSNIKFSIVYFSRNKYLIILLLAGIFKRNQNGIISTRKRHISSVTQKELTPLYQLIILYRTFFEKFIASELFKKYYNNIEFLDLNLNSDVGARIFYIKSSHVLIKL